MCEEFKVDLLTKIPLDPKLLESCDGGKCYVKEFPENKTALAFMDIAKCVVEKSNK